eukprot:scaffold60773_cov44-Phaeocystis_antarctica.AAC.2
MPPMFVTLEVPKLSGWLNADADCRESKGGHTVRCGTTCGLWGGRAAGDRGARSAQGRGPDYKLRAGHGEERTPNMAPMLVTLEVSKLRIWLNVDVLCQESKGGRAVRSEVYYQPAGGRPRCTRFAGEGSAVDWG